MGWIKRLLTERKIKKIESLMKQIDDGIHHSECMTNYHKEHPTTRGKEMIEYHKQQIEKMLILKERGRCKLLTLMSTIYH